MASKRKGGIQCDSCSWPGESIVLCTAFGNSEGGASMDEKIRNSVLSSVRLGIQLRMLSWQSNIFLWCPGQKLGLEV